MLSELDPSYHVAIWVEAVKPLGPIAYILKTRVALLRDLGSCLSPFNAFLFLQGLESLPLPMERHCQNAQAVANFLGQREGITKVHYPSFSGGEERRRPDTYYMGGKYYEALVGFELTGGREAGRKFIDVLQLVYHVANIGDSRTLAVHPSATTQSWLLAKE